VELTLAELAERLGGREIEGDASVRLRGVAALAEGGAADLGFVRSAAFADELAGSRIGAVIAPPGLDARGKPALRSAAPSLDFARAAALLAPRPRPVRGVHARACVDPSAWLDPSASIAALASVGARARVGARTVVHANATLGEDVVVGADCEIHSGAVVGAGCVLGERVILQPGCVIGGDGFGYEFDERGALEKVPQLGNVVLEDDVEVGANATIDRARLGTTRIGRGTKIDNLVQVAHNVEIGAHSVLVAQAGLAGSTRLGERVFFMAQSGAAGHLEIGSGSFIGARGGVIEDLPSGSRVYGFPALAERAWHRANAWLARLPELARRVRALEKRAGIGSDDASDDGPK
jgi:UDP-3-O-[3-hydroxymyristoyl] glucosamine N-acyltransferase